MAFFHSRSDPIINYRQAYMPFIQRRALCHNTVSMSKGVPMLTVIGECGLNNLFKINSANQPEG
jgi:hypothetical protein